MPFLGDVTRVVARRSKTSCESETKVSENAGG